METINKWEEGNFMFHTFIDVDECPDISHLGEYSDTLEPGGIDRKERGDQGRHEFRYFNPGTGDKDYIEEDYKRAEAFNRGDWHMCFVGCEISAKTKTNWAKPPIVARAYLHGIESDSGQDYFEKVAKELVSEAKADLRNLKEAICSAQ